MQLTPRQEAMLDGKQGRPLQLSMRVLVAVGDAHYAEALIPVESAHVGVSISSLGEAGVALLESWVDDGMRFAVPTTTNVLSTPRSDAAVIPATGLHTPVQPDLQNRALSAMARLGAATNCSCNPFVQGHRPQPGTSVAWSESATAPFVNAVLGARTNREGATALASALTGLTPAYGMHLLPERLAEVWFDVQMPLGDLADFHRLGIAVSDQCAERIPVLTGVPPTTDEDQLYAFCAALAACTRLAMFHMVGVTLEATDAQRVLRDPGTRPQRLDPALSASQRSLWQSFAAAEAEMVIIGCPHASFPQLREVARCLGGERIARGRTFLLHTNGEVMHAASADGTLAVLRDAGVDVTTDVCIYAAIRGLPAGTRIATNSAKMASAMRSKGLQATLADTADCVRAMTENPKAEVRA